MNCDCRPTTALDCSTYLLVIATYNCNVGKKNAHHIKQIIICNNEELSMGIHYDYKSTRGDKKMRKQAEKDARRLAKKKSRVETPANTVPEDVVLTLDMITDPNRKND